MAIFKMTVHTDANKSFEFDIEATTPNEALGLLWETKKSDWIRIDTNMPYIEFVNANKIINVTVQQKTERVVSENENAARVKLKR